MQSRKVKPFDEPELTYLSALADRFPDADAALAQIALLEATLGLPKGTVHVVSDVHGEFKKLEHIVRNASGSLRPLVERTFDGRLDDAGRRDLLNLLYYPREAYAHLAGDLAPDPARAFVARTIRLELELLRALVRTRTTGAIRASFQPPFGELLEELVEASQYGRPDAFVDALLAPLLDAGRGVELLRVVARAVRNLAVAELVVAGDLGDRGPRVDKVIDTLRRQPNVAFAWGNHDAEWIGACLGNRALIATVLRISLRYRRLSQLEEGYGIPCAPVEKLARTVYGDDPAERFAVKGEGLRDPLLMARMQKAMAIVQFKLEGQAARRNPHFEQEARCLLHRVDEARATVEIDGERYPMLDSRLPTVDPADPYALTSDETACIERLRKSFLESRILWEQMAFVVRRGATWLRRDEALVFHGCVPVDASGEFLPMRLGGVELRGRALFDALTLAVGRALRAPTDEALDLLWYLWTGPRSPFFGKDKMATFETYFVADKAAHAEKKNPYFSLIHEKDFCARVLAEFGVDPSRGLIVNGHVPVHVEKGESPLKRSGLAVTIDGAFSEAYGDRGYTLVLAPTRTYLAEHHHFESVSDAITRGADIVPVIQELRAFDTPRTIGDTEEGRTALRDIAALRRLCEAYASGALAERERRVEA
ncbi:MAG TPA: fructose-bisphosphatase class III [Minicystis sp.]|nr:fructose-bisphosphatase class III [Minicystis sp.]